VTAVTVASDNNGKASAPFVLGDLPGPYQITASCVNCSQSPVTFPETGMCGYSWNPSGFKQYSPSILFGYLPTPSSGNVRYCASAKARYALNSAANMFSTLLNRNSVSHPVLLDGALKQTVPVSASRRIALIRYWPAVVLHFHSSVLRS
jgi:hypothetical protein